MEERDGRPRSGLNGEERRDVRRMEEQDRALMVDVARVWYFWGYAELAC
jgi:hypothetical protein